MTFMRKILDGLNMNNWKSSSKNSFIRHRNEYLQAIKNFWRSNHQVYRNDYVESSAEEYLIYGITLMLWWFETATPLKTSFPVYFESECHISNPMKVQSNLLSDGYIELAPALAAISSYKMKELKTIANSIGCSKSGNKSELIERIYSLLDQDDLEKIRLESALYTLSDKGKNFLIENYDYVELHRHGKYRISLYEFNKNRIPDGKHKRSFLDNTYTIIAQRIYKNCANKYYYMMEYDYRTLYEIALAEQHFDIATDSYLRFLYLCSCCIRTGQYYSTDFYHGESTLDSEIIFTVHSAPPLVELSDYVTHNRIKSVYKDMSLPPSFLTQEEFENMTREMIESSVFNYEKYNQLLIARLKEYSKL
ncbi:MAG: SAP domain-containing protein [Acetatifactor sp.]